mgnify:CR=1 FL=1
MSGMISQGVLKGEKVSIVRGHQLLNVSMVVMPGAPFIHEGVDSITSPSIEGGSMKESRVGVPLHNP